MSLPTTLPFFQFLPTVLKNNAQIALMAVEQNADVFYHLSEANRGNRAIALTAISHEWYALEYTPAALRLNPVFLLDALEINSEAWFCIPRSIRDDQGDGSHNSSFLERALTRTPDILHYIER